MFGISTDAKQAAMNFGMQSFDPAIHHFRKARDFRNITNRNPCGGYGFRSSPG